MVIGKGGKERCTAEQADQASMARLVIVNVIEVKSPATNAQLVAEGYRSSAGEPRDLPPCYEAVHAQCDEPPRSRNRSRKRGIKAMCSGRLGGADIARTELSRGAPSPADPRADIDYGFAEAATTYGRIGVGWWIYKGAKS